MSLFNAIPEQVIVWIAMGGLLGSFFCFLVATGYQLSVIFPNRFPGQSSARDSKQNGAKHNSRIYCLKRALILSGVGNLLLSTTAAFTAIAVDGGIATLSYICACSLFAFGAWLLHRGLGLKA
jgi:hypothetical protein